MALDKNMLKNGEGQSENMNTIRRKYEALEDEWDTLRDEPEQIFNGMPDCAFKDADDPAGGLDPNKEASPEEMRNRLDKEYSRLKALCSEEGEGGLSAKAQIKLRLVEMAYATLLTRYVDKQEATPEQKNYWDNMKNKRARIRKEADALGDEIELLEEEKKHKENQANTEPRKIDDSYLRFQQRGQRRPSKGREQFKKIMDKLPSKKK